MRRVGAAMAAVAPVHEEVNDRAQKQEGVWQHAKNVRSVFLEQEERCDRQKKADTQPDGDPKGVAW